MAGGAPPPHQRAARAAAALATTLFLTLPAPAAAQPQPEPTYTPLAFGVPATGALAKGAYAFFQLTVPLPLPRLAIVCTPLVGNTDLYVTMGPFWTPEKGNREWESSSVYGDDAVFLDAGANFTALGGYCKVGVAPNCTLNVGVLGVRASNFTLTVTLGGGAGSGAAGGVGSAELLPGVPTGGSLPPGAADVYNFSVPGPAPALTSLRLTPLGGGGSPLAVYVSNAAPRPDPGVPGSVCASATGPAVGGGPTGALVVPIPSGSACACTGAAQAACTLYVSVLSGAAPGAPDARYTLVGTTTAGSPFAALVDGAPQEGAGAEGAASLYSFAAELDPPGTPGGVTSVEVSVAPTRGAVQLYVLLAPGGAPPGAGAPLPGPGAFTYASGGGSGSQAVTVSSGDPRLAAGCPAYASGPCTLLIAVVPTSVSAGWALTAASGAYVTLLPGVPVEGAAPGGGVAFFRFPLPRAGGPVVITAAATAGEPNLFVGSDAANGTTAPVPWDPSSYVWSAQAGGDVVLVVPPADPAACASLPCAFYIGVASADWATNASTGFYLMARTNGTGPGAAAPLAIGDALQDVVPGGGACNAYYTPLDPAGTPSVAVLAYVDAGAVALYGRVDNGTALAGGPWQYVGASGDAGGDGSAGWLGFAVTAGDPPVAAACAGGAPCGVSVAVCSNTTGGAADPAAASSYLLQATAGETRLTDGLPVQGMAQPAPAVALYRFTLPERAPFTVALTQLSGDADLLMAVGTPPNASWSQWSSASPAGDFLAVSWAEPWLDPARNPAAGTFPLDFWIGVTGFDARAEYSLVAASSPYVTLEDGVPQAAAAKGGTLTYFLLTLPPPDALGFEVGFTLAVDPTSGDPAPLVYGNTVNHTRAACAHCGFPYCRGGGACTPGGVAQFNRHWSSLEQGPLVIEVDTSDPNYETESAYVFAMLVQQDSTFTVTATFTDSIARVLNQVPTQGAAPAGGYAYYFLDMVNPSVQLTVTLGATAGAPDLFVSVNSTLRRPNATAYSKAALAGSGGMGGELALVFTWAELPECPDSSVDHTVFCQAYIAVRGGGGLPAAFTLTADAVDVNASEILLPDGVPVVGVLAQGQYGYYKALVDVPPGSTYSVTLNPYRVAKLDLFATTDGSRPSATNFQFSSARANGPEQLTIAPGAPGYNASCTLRVAVLHPFVDYAGFDVTFEAAGLTTLLPGQPAFGNVQVVPPPPAVQFGRFYALQARAPGAPGQDEVVVAFTGASGLAPQLLVGATDPASAAGFQPLPNTSGVCATGGGGYAQVVAIRRGDPCFCTAPCTYIAAVVCPGVPYGEPTCVYALTGTTSSGQPVALVDGARLANAVPPGAGGVRLFTYDMTLLLAGGDNVTLTAASGDGASPVALVATNAPGGGGGPVWSSNATGPPGPVATLTVRATDPAVAGCPGCTLLTVGVMAPPPGVGVGADAAAAAAVGGRAAAPPGYTPFTLTVSSTAGNDPPIRLALGQPSTPQVKAYKTWTSFVVQLTETTQDLIVDVTPLSGRAAVSVDPLSQRPRCYVGPPPARVIRCDSVWSQPVAADGPIRISAAAPCANANVTPCDPAAVWRPGPYFITVLAYYSPTQFVVNAYTPDASVALTDGLPAGFSTSNAPGGGAVLALRVPPGPAQAAPVQLVIISADGFGLLYGVGACVLPAGGGGGGAGGVCPGGRPTPANASLTGRVPPRSTVTVAIAPGDPAYCADPAGAAACLYQLAVLPPPGCAGGVCSAAGTVVGSTTGPGGPPTVVPWSSVAGAVAVVGGVAPPPPGRAGVQLLLSPPAAGGPVDVGVVLDACGPDAPGVFLCDPATPAPAGGCANAFAPGPGPRDHTAANSTLGRPGGRAVLGVTQTAASVLFLAVGDEAQQGAGGGFSLQLSALGSALYLVAAPAGGPGGPPAPVSIVSAGGGALSLSWPQATVASWDGAATSRPAVGVAYTLFLAPGGFGPSVPFTAVQPSTPCGLARWAAVVAPGVQAVTGLPLPDPDVTAVVLSPLPPAPGGYYEVAVVATCNATCLRASGADPGAPALAPLAAAYGWVGVTLPPGPPNPGGGGGGDGGGNPATSPGALASYSVGGLLAVAGAVLLAVRARRANAYDALVGSSGRGGLGLRRPDGFGALGAETDLEGSEGGAGAGSAALGESLLEGAVGVGDGGDDDGAPLSAVTSPVVGSSSRGASPALGGAALQHPAGAPRSPGLRATRLGHLRASVSVSSPSALPGAASIGASPPLLALSGGGAPTPQLLPSRATPIAGLEPLGV